MAVSVLGRVVCLAGGRACWAHPFWGWIAGSVLRASVLGRSCSFCGLLSEQIALSGTWTLD